MKPKSSLKKSPVKAPAERVVKDIRRATRRHFDDDEVRYHGIKRTIGKQRPSVRQIDRLMNTADRMQIPALYSFYNHLSDTSRIPVKCGSLVPGDPGHKFGYRISLAEANSVLAALPDELFNTHCRHSIPLHYLLCSGGSGRKGSGGSPDAIAAMFGRMRDARGAPDTD